MIMTVEDGFLIRLKIAKKFKTIYKGKLTSRNGTQPFLKAQNALTIEYSRQNLKQNFSQLNFSLILHIHVYQLLDFVQQTINEMGCLEDIEVLTYMYVLHEN